MGDVLTPKRHPAWRRREAQSGSCTERENLAGDAKGKGTSGSNREAESTDAPERGGLPRVVLKRGNARGAKGGVIAFEIGSTGNGRNPIFNGRRQPSCGGTSRMTRECQVRICERLGVKFPGPTRPLFELIPLLQQPPAICRYPGQCLAAVARRDCSGKYPGIGDAEDFAEIEPAGPPLPAGERSECARLARTFRVRGLLLVKLIPLTRIAQARSDLSPAGRGTAGCTIAR